MPDMLQNFSSIVQVLQNVVQAVNNLNQTAANIFPQFTGTSTTATTGTNGAQPAQVEGYLDVIVNGTPVKVPFFKI